MTKYRAWHENGEYVYFDYEIMTKDRYQRQWFMDLAIQDKLEASIQGTDKNGKEIYEGDIVRFGKRFGVIFYNKEQASFQIKPNDGNLSGVPHLNVGSLKYIEVIGNIHEGGK